MREREREERRGGGGGCEAEGDDAESRVFRREGQIEIPAPEPIDSEAERALDVLDSNSRVLISPSQSGSPPLLARTRICRRPSDPLLRLHLDRIPAALNF